MGYKNILVSFLCLVFCMGFLSACNVNIQISTENDNQKGNEDVSEKWLEEMRQAEEEQIREAVSVASGGETEYTEIEVSDSAIKAASEYGTIGRAFKLSNGGYVVDIEVEGSQGPIHMVAGIGPNNHVTGVSVIRHSETGGIGSKAINNDLTPAGIGFLDQFRGRDGAEELVVGENIYPISGATVTSKAITAGVNGALAVVDALLTE